FFQNGFELRVWVMCWGQLLTKVQKWPDHIGLHWSGTKQRNINDEIINGFGFEFTNKFPLTWGLNLKTTQRVSRFDHCISLGIIVWNMFKIDGFAGGSGNLIDSIGDCELHTYAYNVEFEHAHWVHSVFIELAHGQAHTGSFHGGTVQQGLVPEDATAGVHRDVAGEPVRSFREVHE